MRKYVDQYCVAIYLRLSKDDGDISVSNGKTESNSISSQRAILQHFCSTLTGVTDVVEYCDDGYTGTNFNRPGFQQMMQDVNAGKIQCIVVKDLSRFGREYIEVGRYLQKTLPALNVRFIAVNDNFDSGDERCRNDFLSLVVRNMMNDAYCRDISIKVRSNLEAKRRSGEYVGNHLPYGYMRSETDRHQLVLDSEAAKVVQSIFQMKVDGMSAEQIALHLNHNGVPSPLEYKKANGSKQQTSFQRKAQAQWSAVAIYRILKNPVYIGTLVQGKRTTPNYKIKKTVVKSEGEWVCIENAHEAIVSPALFDLVQNLLLEDTRSPSGESTVHLFSGKIYCADCKHPMIRRVYNYDRKTYVYFTCGNNKQQSKNCSSHRITESAVTEVVLEVIRSQIALIMEISEIIDAIDGLAWEKQEIEKIAGMIAHQEEQMRRYQRFKIDAYEDYRSGLISQEDFKTITTDFDKRLAESKQVIERLTSERNKIVAGTNEQQSWFQQWKQYQNITQLDRRTVVNFVDRILIHDDKTVEVKLLHMNQLAEVQRFIEEQQNVQSIQLEKEAG